MTTTTPNTQADNKTPQPTTQTTPPKTTLLNHTRTLPLENLERAINLSKTTTASYTDGHVSVPTHILERLVKIAQGIREIRSQALVSMENPGVMAAAAHHAACMVQGQMEVAVLQVPNSHPLENRGTVVASAFSVDPLVVKYL